MSDDYLWDRSGEPDPDVLHLERMLPRLRERVRRAASSDWVTPAPVSRRGHPVASLAIAAALALSLGAGGWWVGRTHGRAPLVPIRGEPAPPTAATPPTPATASAEPAPPAPSSTTPRAAPAPVPKAPSPAPSAEPEGAGRSAAAIHAVVARHQAEVRSRCWEPALAKRKDGAAPVVKLGVTFSIAASGKVGSVSAGPTPPDYPGLAACVSAEVRSWDFGPADGATTVVVPFLFAEARQ